MDEMRFESSVSKGTISDGDGPNHLAPVPPFRTTRRRVFQGLAAGTVTGFLGWQDTEAATRRRKHGRHRRRHQPDHPRHVAARGDEAGSPTALKVMTRNLYLGADLGPVFRVTSQQQLVAAVTQVFAMVQATNFPERAKALAAEIAENDPHVVGLQEVTLWRSQTPADFDPKPNAKDVAYDFLATLLAELTARGKDYEAVVTVQNADAEAPRFTATGLQDIRITDHDAMLVRTDLPRSVFSVANAQSATFAATLSFPNPVIGTVRIPRGWTAIDVTLNGGTVRVVNTHLERLQPSIQEAQGNELLAGPLATSLPVVLLGDLNSAADAATGGGTPGESSTTTYATIMAAEFDDAWTATRGDDPGFTWGQAEDLRNPAPTLSERIDVILTRGLRASSANRIGAEPEDRTPLRALAVRSRRRLGRAASRDCVSGGNGDVKGAARVQSTAVFEILAEA